MRRSEWEWTEAELPINVAVLVLRVPPGEYDRESLALMAKVPVEVVLSNDITLLREHGGKF